MSRPGLLSPITQYRDIFLLAAREPRTDSIKWIGYIAERAKTLMDQSQEIEDFFSAEFHRGIYDLCRVMLEHDDDLEKFNERWSHYV